MREQPRIYICIKTSGALNLVTQVTRKQEVFAYLRPRTFVFASATVPFFSPPLRSKNLIGSRIPPGPLPRRDDYSNTSQASSSLRANAEDSTRRWRNGRGATLRKRTGKIPLAQHAARYYAHVTLYTRYTRVARAVIFTAVSPNRSSRSHKSSFRGRVLTGRRRNRFRNENSRYALNERSRMILSRFTGGANRSPRSGRIGFLKTLLHTRLLFNFT